MPPKRITVEVVYAQAADHVLVRVEFSRTSTLRDAIEQSGVLRRHPEIDLPAAKVGVYGKLKKLTDVLEPGDRVEIYRELTADPKEARRRRARAGRR